METNSVAGLTKPSNENDIISKSYDVDNDIQEIKKILRDGFHNISFELRNQCHDGNEGLERVLEEILSKMDKQSLIFERNESNLLKSNELSDLIGELEEKTNHLANVFSDLKNEESKHLLYYTVPRCFYNISNCLVEIKRSLKK